jgi:very-short-patch-repair endonuclease
LELEIADAVADCGDGAFASHLAAAFIWGLVERPPERIDVTVPARRRPRPHGVVVHRSQLTGPGEHTRRKEIAVARPNRALLGVAAVAPDAVLTVAVDEAVRRGLTAIQPLLHYLERPEVARFPGRGRIRRLVRDRVTGVPESVLESMTLELIERYALPAPTRQHRAVTSGTTVRFDLAYPDARVAIEADGQGPHASRWQQDHDRHNATELSEWRVLRFTYKDVKARPSYVAFTIADALGLRPARWRPT